MISMLGGEIIMHFARFCTGLLLRFCVIAEAILVWQGGCYLRQARNVMQLCYDWLEGAQIYVTAGV